MNIVFDFDGILSRGQSKKDVEEYEKKAIVFIKALSKLFTLHCCSFNSNILDHIIRMGIYDNFKYIGIPDHSKTKEQIISEWNIDDMKDKWILIDDNSFNAPQNIDFIHLPDGLF